MGSLINGYPSPKLAWKLIEGPIWRIVVLNGAPPYFHVNLRGVYVAVCNEEFLTIAHQVVLSTQSGSCQVRIKSLPKGSLPRPTRPSRAQRSLMVS